MVDRYGSANGFGWKLNDIVTAQIVSVPTQLAIQRARDVLKTFMLSLAGVFGLLLVAINVLLIFIVIRRVHQSHKHGQQRESWEFRYKRVSCVR